MKAYRVVALQQHQNNNPGCEQLKKTIEAACFQI
jgi:hypothetical protein